jgi:molybdopterin-guanine dinucleotide biosynthesis protein A
MGRDKGLVHYHGKEQREHLFDLLQVHCSKVFTSSYPGQNIPEELNPLVDAYELRSPINGILSAFKKFPDVAWLVVAVDMPNVDQSVLKLLTDNRDQNKIATCFYNPEEKLPEPLLTLWEPSALPLLLKFVEKGKISPRDFLNQHDVKLIQPPDVSIFRNINSPDELLS